MIFLLTYFNHENGTYFFIQQSGERFYGRFDENDDDFSHLDPTKDDTDRIFATGKAASRIQLFMQKSGRCRYYVPCTIRISGLAQSPVSAASKNPSKAKRSSFSRDEGSKTRDAGPSNPLAFGTVDTLSRLLMGSVWISPTAVKTIWRMAQDPKAGYLAREVRRRSQVALVSIG